MGAWGFYGRAPGPSWTVSAVTSIAAERAERRAGRDEETHTSPTSSQAPNPGTAIERHSLLFPCSTGRSQWVCERMREANLASTLHPSIAG